MRPEEMTLVRPVVEDFAADVFGGFARRDQRAKHRQLQQFVTTSTWDHVEVRRRLALWARDFVDPEGELDELDYGGRSVTAAFDTSRLRHQPPRPGPER